MRAELEQLLILQDRQQKIRQIENEIKNLPLQRKHLESQLAESVTSLDAIKQRARQVEVDRKKLELDVGTRNESINRLKTQQYQTRKNDEFQAMGHEIHRYEEEIRKLEDQELELMEQGDKLKVEVTAEEKKSAATKDSIARQMNDLGEKSKVLETRLLELSKERKELAEKMDEDVVGRFERLFVSKGDSAIVAIEHGVCTGCHMKLTIATVKAAEGGKEIVNCEQCGRILYIPA
ncbi:MAG TPA: C4-type zinc ribbon domain-containing protein [Chthoniobacterales bacterium]|nr:C4-type zinc ribbon domain-containing protein [Chthoniobacterales bacterium]